MPPSLSLSLGRRSARDVVGLDIQPGFVAAVQAHVNGGVLAERASTLRLAPDAVREGDVVDGEVLSESLRRLFAGARLGKRVRVGVANQRTVMRTLELPPVSDPKDLAAAVQFQAQDQVPMPLANAIIDFQPLGVVETPAGPRQQVVLVAAQRDMVERLLAAVRRAGLSPVGLDMSAFALIRALYHPDQNSSERVLYLNVDGLTNVAIAEGAVCRFTRVLGGGIEELTAELAVRRGVPVDHARGLLADVDLTPAAAEQAPAPDAAQPGAEPEPGSEVADAAEWEPLAAGEDPAQPHVSDDHNDPAQSAAAPGEEPTSQLPPDSYAAEVLAAAPAPPAGPSAADDARDVLENGLRAIAGEVRNSLDFHRSQEGGADVSRVVLSGSALEFSGFAEALQTLLGVEVQAKTVSVADSVRATVSAHRLAVAAGLATEEARR